MSRLVLSRKAGERLFINGREIEIFVVDIRSDRVRLSIIAPESVTVNREEVLIDKEGGAGK